MKNSENHLLLPQVPGLRESRRVYTSLTMLEHQALPRQLVVLGGCLVGMEFALTYAQFGSCVTILETASTLQLQNEVGIEDIIYRVLTHKNIALTTGACLHRIELGAEADTVVYEDKNGTIQSQSASAILVTAGCLPVKICS